MSMYCFSDLVYFYLEWVLTNPDKVILFTLQGWMD